MDELEFGAYDVCQSFVEDGLRSPGTASFPNLFEDDGEIIVTDSGEGGTYTVTAHVDTENGFGGEVREDFICTLRHVANDEFRLVDLQFA